MLEDLQKAKDSLQFAREHAMQANKTANALEHLLLMEIIGDLANAQNKLNALILAKKEVDNHS